MKELGYYNGRIGELSEMTVPMSDRACWFGDGVYEAQMCRNYHIFTLDEHVDRLFRSAAMSSRISQLNIIDILYTAYANRQYEYSLKQLRKTHIKKTQSA